MLLFEPLLLVLWQLLQIIFIQKQIIQTILIQITETFKKSIIQQTIYQSLKINNKAMINQVYILDFVPPHFIMRFKQKIVNFLIPKLYDLKDLINSQQKKSEKTDPIIAVVVVLIIAFIIKTVYKGLFQEKQQLNSSNSSSNIQYEQLNRQLVDMKKQLIAFKQSFTQLKKSMAQNNQSHLTGAAFQPNQNLPNKQNHIQSNSNESLVKQLFPFYSKSMQNNKKLAMYILDSQQQAFKQLKRLRKVNHLLTSNGRPSTRSRTSDTKLIGSSEKSTQKKSINSTILKQNLPVEKQRQKPNVFSSAKAPLQVSCTKKATHTQPQVNELIEKVQQKNMQKQTNRQIQQVEINTQPFKLPMNQISPPKPRKVIPNKNLNYLQDAQLSNYNAQAEELHRYVGQPMRQVQQPIRQAEKHIRQVEQPIRQVEQPKLFNQFESKQTSTKQQNPTEVVIEQQLKQEQIKNIYRPQESTQVILDGPPVVPPKLSMKKPMAPSKMGARKAPPPPVRK